MDSKCPNLLSDHTATICSSCPSALFCLPKYTFSTRCNIPWRVISGEFFPKTSVTIDRRVCLNDIEVVGQIFHTGLRFRCEMHVSSDGANTPDLGPGETITGFHGMYGTRYAASIALPTPLRWTPSPLMRPSGFAPK